VAIFFQFTGSLYELNRSMAVVRAEIALALVHLPIFLAISRP